MSEKKISQIVLEKIKDIKPKPKWKFILREYFIWGLGVFSFIIGSFAFAVVLYMLRYNDWEVYENINESLLGFIILTLPYFWIVLIGLFIWLLDYNIKHTKKGYKYDIKFIISISVLSSMLFGALLFEIGAGRFIDDVLSENIPFYKNIINNKMGIWSHPEKGLLLGEIINVSKDSFQIIEPNGNIWTINNKNSKIMPMVEILEGRGIKMIGKKIGENNFVAEIITQIGPGRGCLKNSGPGGCRPPRHMFPPHPPLDIMMNNGMEIEIDE